ncbi:hypothetical protein SELMODRAFT_115079 [Selaginella moellendorffii]|uniref:Transcription factor CBF/NF-Y/archaeal histone domain-containing protein n=1 Tax=Selaginella moellendorffii TaxID=88036 RepID=D8SEL0_SELML|nr:DNA polymerase epsilon subunit 3 [Selaginella moellendorffii]EFJ17220.1 hypothetical protein SELMODRAFT_115079 [Selaginella moellendorffii]|eukprot:XP_002981738.1 DNA polymerase epsilon subunit 3 [Selaginella moellendorffii]
MVVPPESEELPRANIKRIVKAKLAELARSQLGQERDIPVQKEAFQAFAESTRIFIHYLSATANDICRETKRQTINADDVLRALDDLEFGEFVEPLRASLEGYKAGRKSMPKKSSTSTSKRKTSTTKNKDKAQKAFREGDGEDEEETMQ